MKLMDFESIAGVRVADYDSMKTTALHLGSGVGESHIYTVRVEPGGYIGQHEAASGQLFLVIRGSGWAEGDDGEHIHLNAGQGVYIAKGEMHSKGSNAGMLALMIQVRDLHVPSAPLQAVAQ